MPRHSSRSRTPNVLAAAILATTIGILYASFDPVPAGESPAVEANQSATTTADVEDFIVPLPPEAAAIPVAEATAGQVEGPQESDTPAPAAPAPSTLSNNELVEYTLLLLKDGADYLKQFDTYKAVFHKQERLGGDLSDVQTIELKIRQGENFAVYMRWRNGDRGRQLLYSSDYEDGDMVVKLGGFKGRLLPGIKLNPTGSRALQEARHPVTQAGILGMVNKMIGHRQKDLSHGHGVTCTKLANQEFDQRDCMCFLYEYESREVSENYRKSVILLDAKYHFPVMARNYTWATDSADLSPEELDELTLVENYSFTKIDFSKVLTAIEFSRDNPRYRM